MTRTPLPAANDDPNVIAARKAEADYTQTVTALRANLMISDLARAEQIDSAWRGLYKTRAELATKFYDARRARLESLEAEIPIGPNIPESTNRADAVVLHQAFNSALEVARDADLTKLERLWTDAQRFDDDTARRAVLTAAMDRGLNQFVASWASSDPNRLAGIKEMAGLRELMSGRSTDARFASQAFQNMGFPKQPQESLDLPVLKERAATLAARRAQGFVA